jgi:ribosomal 30S subunit maturation factor RimM
MNKMRLLDAAGLAVFLMGAPAYAQNAGVAGAGGVSIRVAANGSGTVDNAPPAGRAGNNAAVIGNGHYANVGFGSYTGKRLYITAERGNTNNINGNNNNSDNSRPSQRNPLLADNGDARASKMIGTTVYNKFNQKLGNVNDILIGANGVYAVIDTNNKQVAVPFGDLRFGNATDQGNEKIVMPNETEARLNMLPVFHYNVTHYPGANANTLNPANFAGGFGSGALGTTGSNAGVGVYTTGGNAGGGPYGGANQGGLAMSANAGGGGANSNAGMGRSGAGQGYAAGH